jgi:phosphonate transport system substrate-binding protein
MTYQFTVSPDFTPEHLSGWHIFNTWLQKKLDLPIHLELYDSFDLQREAINSDNVDLIYANPFDASMLVREKGFIPIAKPKGKQDEAVVVVNDENPAQCVEDLQAGLTVATTDDPDVHMMGMIMLESGDLDASNTTLKQCDTYVVVAKELIRGQSDVGLFLAEAFGDLSGMVRKQLRPLVSSEIFLIHHILMISPKLAEQQAQISEALLSMKSDEKGPGVLESLGVEEWEAMEQEDMEFMIDLVSTLVE